jgi:hypothetical protein
MDAFRLTQRPPPVMSAAASERRHTALLPTHKVSSISQGIVGELEDDKIGEFKEDIPRAQGYVRHMVNNIEQSGTNQSPPRSKQRKAEGMKRRGGAASQKSLQAEPRTISDAKATTSRYFPPKSSKQTASLLEEKAFSRTDFATSQLPVVGYLFEVDDRRRRVEFEETSPAKLSWTSQMLRVVGIPRGRDEVSIMFTPFAKASFQVRSCIQGSRADLIFTI